MYSDSVLRRRRACRSGATIPAPECSLLSVRRCASPELSARCQNRLLCRLGSSRILIRCPSGVQTGLMSAGIERELRGGIARPVGAPNVRPGSAGDDVDGEPVPSGAKLGLLQSEGISRNGIVCPLLSIHKIGDSIPRCPSGRYTSMPLSGHRELHSTGSRAGLHAADHGHRLAGRRAVEIERSDEHRPAAHV